MGGRLGWEGITSNTIACGLFPSKMTAWSLKNEWSNMTEKIPLTRAGTPEDVAGTALFLASRAGAYVNAATITLDGGMTSAYPLSRL
jgi:NAD(P)-dependent dehydrogenase (short-subunit alcohol dehydrogenase family)